MVLLYHTGIIGLLLYFYPYVISLLKSIAKKDVIKLTVTVTFFLIAIGANLHLSSWFIPFAAFILNPEKKQKDGDCDNTQPRVQRVEKHVFSGTPTIMRNKRAILFFLLFSI